MSDLLCEYVSGPRKGQRIWASAATVEKLAGVVRVVAGVQPGPGGQPQVVPVGVAGEKSNG